MTDSTIAFVSAISEALYTAHRETQDMPNEVVMHPADEVALLRDAQFPMRSEDGMQLFGIRLRVDRTIPQGQFRLEYEHTRDRMMASVQAAISDYHQRCGAAPVSLHLGLDDGRLILGQIWNLGNPMRIALSVTIGSDGRFPSIDMLAVDVEYDRVLPPRSFYLTPRRGAERWTPAVACSMPGRRPPFIWIGDPFGDQPDTGTADLFQRWANRALGDRWGHRPPRDPAAFDEARRANHLEIASIYGVPRHLMAQPSLEHPDNPLLPPTKKKKKPWKPKAGVELGGEPATDIVDQISELVDMQLGQESSGYDHPINQQDCPNPECDYHWHGLPITAEMRRMRAAGEYNAEYRYDADTSEVLCPGSGAL